ncbi:hypothetical protein GE09DRAFT_1111987 [Coniochaeta sp. 2T2.1]|nr:hypothetical protein GE09DRAFT_1111987 [Coniochaeta sp. 2T2.1]
MACCILYVTYVSGYHPGSGRLKHLWEMSGYHSGSGRLKHLGEMSGTTQGVAGRITSGRCPVTTQGVTGGCQSRTLRLHVVTPGNPELSGSGARVEKRNEPELCYGMFSTSPPIHCRHDADTLQTLPQGCVAAFGAPLRHLQAMLPLHAQARLRTMPQFVQPVQMDAHLPIFFGSSAPAFCTIEQVIFTSLWPPGSADADSLGHPRVVDAVGSLA